MSAYKSVPLLPCPHCADSDIRVTCHSKMGRGLHDGEDVFSMCCYACGATVPNRYSRDLLIEAWNRRAAPRVPDTDTELVERLRAAGPNSGYMLIMTEAAERLAAQADEIAQKAREIESLRAQCGLRQIQGYHEGRQGREDEIARLKAELDELTTALDDREAKICERNEAWADAEANRRDAGYREWSHSCNACLNTITLWVAGCPHCGMSRPAAIASNAGTEQGKGR